MRKYILQNTDLEVSALCLGTATFGGTGTYEKCGNINIEEAKRVLDFAMDHGINFFNTAEHYSSGLAETVLGKALGNRRKDVVIIDKICPERPTETRKGGLSRKHIFERCEASLKKLGTDYIDIYEPHIFDPIIPLEETLEALNDLIKEGKIRYFGCSSFSGWQFMKALAICDKNGWNRFVTLEAKYTLLTRELENELMPACEDQHVDILAFAPLYGGYLSGKYARNKPWPTGTRIQAPTKDKGSFNTIDLDRLYDVVDVMEEIAKERQQSVSNVAMNYVLSKPPIRSVIFSVRNEEQLKQNIDASDWQLTPDEIARLDEVSEAEGIYPYRESKFGFLYSPEN